MLRLVQGDVGCGKTLVAASAATQAVQAGRQAALMAPTELLADQHAQNLLRWFEPLGRRGGAAHRPAERQGARRRPRRHSRGHARIVVGTHALFQESVRFAALALVIVDEQHRFGVHQRLACARRARAGGHQPHQLIMTATPDSAHAGDDRLCGSRCLRDRRVAAGPHAGEDRGAAGHAPRRSGAAGRTPACAGRQAYWVCPLIEESEEMPYQAAEETAAALAAALPEVARRAGARPHAAARQGERHAANSRPARFSCWWRPR